jgi:hypothetical protein
MAKTFTMRYKRPDSALEHCPICRSILPVPKDIYGETRCPRCSCELWHLLVGSGPSFFVRRSGETIYDLLADLADARHRFTAADVERTLCDADPLDVAEFLSELEDAARS